MNASKTLTTIICSHDPRPDYLARTIDSLRRQSLRTTSWELLLVDNASSPDLSGWSDKLSWHPKARIIREPKLGLTPARIRGIRESAGDIIVFIDDDNVLSPDYLQTARDLFSREERLGTAGGRIVGEFEIAPRPWAVPHLQSLAIRDFDEPPSQGTNTDGRINNYVPCGAGMVVRADVARSYADGLGQGSSRILLDRTGNNLIGGGDMDISYEARALGYYTTFEPSLRLTHLIPRSRLTLRYLARLLYSVRRSDVLLAGLRGREVPRMRLPASVVKLIAAARLFRTPLPAWILASAEEWGRIEGIDEFARKHSPS